MQTLRSIIIDDDSMSLEGLKRIIDLNVDNVKVCALCETIQAALQAIEEWDPHLVFLDIQLRGENGFDLFAKVPDPHFEVIFVTAYSDYAIKAMRYSAVDYLLKPVDVDELRNAVHKVALKKNHTLTQRINFLIENLKVNDPKHLNLALPTLEGITFIKADEILYLRASGNYTEIFTKDGHKYTVSRQLNEYEDILGGDFFRVHRSFLINLNFATRYIKGENGVVVMADGTSINVSRKKREALLETLKG